MMKNKRLLPIILLASSTLLSGCISGILDATSSIIQDVQQTVDDINVIVNPDPSKDYSDRGSTDEKEIIKEEVETKYDFTIMYYLCASNLEYDPDMGIFPGDRNVGFFSQDLREILSINFPSNVKIIVETGGTTKWCATSDMLEGASSISSKSLERWEVSGHKLKHIATLNTNHMADQNSFEDFLKWGLRDYSATRMGVVISSHGGGIAGCAYDDNFTYKYGMQSFQNVLDTSEIAIASKNALATFGREKFTFIGYDACVMACADIASINADYYEYMVASQELEPGSGWDQRLWLTELANNVEITTEALLSKIVDSFVTTSHLGCPYVEENEIYTCDATLSVFDLSKMNKVTEEFNNYIGSLSLNNAMYQLSFMNSYDELADGQYGLTDFKSFLKSIQRYAPAAINLEKAIDEVVISNQYCSNIECDLCGMNLFYPYSSDKYYGLQVGKNDYKGENMTKFTKWQEICLKASTWTF